jgi:hypothetical protein
MFTDFVSQLRTVSFLIEIETLFAHAFIANVVTGSLSIHCSAPNLLEAT